MKNLHNAAALIRDDLVTVRCVWPYNNKSGEKKGDTIYTYLCKRSLAENLQPDDRVLTSTAKYPCNIMIVHSVDPEPDIDLESHFELGWVFQHCDEHAAKVLREEHAELVKALENKRKVSVREAMLMTLGISSDEVKQLTGGSNGSAS